MIMNIIKTKRFKKNFLRKVILKLNLKMTSLTKLKYLKIKQLTKLKVGKSI